MPKAVIVSVENEVEATETVDVASERVEVGKVIETELAGEVEKARGDAVEKAIVVVDRSAQS